MKSSTTSLFVYSGPIRPLIPFRIGHPFQFILELEWLRFR